MLLGFLHKQPPLYEFFLYFCFLSRFRKKPHLKAGAAEHDLCHSHCCRWGWKLLKLLLSFLGMIDITKAHWQASGWKFGVSMEIRQPVRRTHSLLTARVCLWLFVGKSLNLAGWHTGANVEVAPLLKTNRRVRARSPVNSGAVGAWTNCDTFSTSRATLQAEISLPLWTWLSNNVLSLVSLRQVRRGQTLVVISVGKP